VSSEKRDYLPAGFVNSKEMIPNSAQVIYDANPYVLGIIASRLHACWVKTTGGRLRSDIRYSSLICYNNFPFPEINKKQKEQIHSHVLNILSEREKYPEKTIAELYDPQKMPAGLKSRRCCRALLSI
jgi:triacylglycerol esterase/lipase EstA (alpha/beta hydrolase family)